MLTKKLILFVTSLCILNESANGQDVRTPGQTEQSAVQNAYLHGGAGMNLFLVSSDDISNAIEPYSITAGVGFNISLLAGLRNILQLEYRHGRDQNAFKNVGGFSSDLSLISEEIDMAFRHNTGIVKLNPLFLLTDDRSTAIFVLLGTGSVDYFDDANDGFPAGEKTVFGLEFSKIKKNVSVGVSLENHSFRFDHFDVRGFDPVVRPFEGSYLQLNLKLAAGFGF